MKFKKMIAGIMSAVMLATSAFAVNAGAEGLSKIEPIPLGYTVGDVEWDINLFPDELESITFKGQFSNYGLDPKIYLKDRPFIVMYFPVVSDNYDIIYVASVLEEEDKLGYDEKTGLYNYECTVDFEELKKEGMPTVLNKKNKDYGVFRVVFDPGKFSIQELIINGKNYMLTAPAKTTLKSSVKDGKATLSWTAVDGAEKYQVCYSTDGGKTYKVLKTLSSSKTKLTLSVTKGKTYKFAVRSYKTVNGKKVYSKFSNVKTIKY